MTIKITQDIHCQYTPHKYAELYFTIRGAADEDAAGEALGDPWRTGTTPETFAAPKTYKGLFRKRRTVEAVHMDTDDETHAANIFKATVYYDNIDPDNYTTEFDTTGGSQHITQSFNTISSYAPTGQPIPNLQGAINYDGETVNGTDIVIPTLTFEERHYHKKSVANYEYRMLLSLMTGTVNNAPFRGYAAGEVLFKGARGMLVPYEHAEQEDESEQWLITYTFGASPNRLVANGNALLIGNISNVEKLGWDYLWVLYGEDVSGGRLIKKPVAAYVERLYDFSDFSALLIGTSVPGWDT